MNRRKTTIAIALTALALVVSACGGRDADSADASPGITDSKVVIGTSYPMTGPASAYGNAAKGMEIYLDHINEQGGVKMADGKTRKVELIVRDDGYDPAKTVTNVQRLVEQDKVFAMHNILGTPTHAAVVDYLNDNKIPDVFVGSVAGEVSEGIEEHPWTVGWQPSNEMEWTIYGKYIRENLPGSKVAILFQNDDAGKPALTAFEAAIEGSGIEIVARESTEVTDATVDSQIAVLAASGADVFLNITSPKAAAQAISRADELNWRPKQFLNSTSTSVSAVLEPAGLKASTGIYSAEWLKVPGDPRWADDPAMKEYEEIVATYGSGVDPDERLVAYGVAAAQTLVGTLAELEEPTREAFMDTVRNLDLEIPMLTEGARVHTDSDNLLPIRQMQLQQFDGSIWKAMGDVIDGTKS